MESRFTSDDARVKLNKETLSDFERMTKYREKQIMERSSSRSRMLDNLTAQTLTIGKKSNAQGFLFLGAILAFLAVMFGAFGAHGLRGRIDANLISVYQTAVQYHFWHALGLGLIASWCARYPDSRLLLAAGYSLCLGIMLFSGSLYLLVMTGQHWLGMITPIGGLAFMTGWILLAIFAWRYPFSTNIANNATND